MRSQIISQHVAVMESLGRGFCADTTGQLEPYQAVCKNLLQNHLSAFGATLHRIDD